MFKKAVALDPEFALAYALLGMTHWRAWSLQLSCDPDNLEQSLGLGQRAVAIVHDLCMDHLIRILRLIQSQTLFRRVPNC